MPNITSKEKIWIETMQKAYLKKFGKKLAIDWKAMTEDITIQELPKRVSIEEEQLRNILKSCAERYNLTLEDVTNKRSYHRKKDNLHPNIQAAIADYSTLVFTNNWNKTIAAKVANRDRNTLYFYANGKNYINEQGEKVKYFPVIFNKKSSKNLIDENFRASTTRINMSKESSNM